MLLRPNIDVVDPHSEIPLYQSGGAVSLRPIGGNRKNRGLSPRSLFYGDGFGSADPGHDLFYAGGKLRTPRSEQ